MTSKTSFEVMGYLISLNSFRTNDKKFKETLQKICMEHTAITRSEFRFPYSRDTIYFKTDSPLMTYDEKEQPCTLENLLQNNVTIKGTIFQYNFESQGKKIIGVSVKIREVKGMGSNIVKLSPHKINHS